MKKIYSLTLLFLAAATIVTSCRNKNEESEPQTPAPEILVIGGPADTTVQVGSAIQYTPKIASSTISDMTFAWYVNGEKKAVTKDFKAEFPSTGLHKLELIASNATGNDTARVVVRVFYKAGGFYLLNEGQFGKEMGSISYYNYKSNTVTPYIDTEANDGKQVLGVTSCFGTLTSDAMYITSKQGNRLAALDKYSLKLTDALTTMPNNSDSRAVTAIDDNHGVVTTSKGAYIVTFKPALTAGAQLADTENAQCGAVAATDKYIFVIKQGVGVLVYDANSYQKVKQIDGPTVGFARTVNGTLWCGDKSKLWGINSSTLVVTEVNLPQGVSINNSWGAWNAGQLVSSGKDSNIYFVKSASMWGGGNEVYRYDTYKTNTPAAVFATGASDDSFYGAGIGVDPKTGDIVATFVQGYNYFDNRLVVFDAKTGIETTRTTYQGYLFPTMLIFQ